VAVVFSLIPAFTPVLMMLRVVVKMPPLWQVVLAYALTTSFILFMMWVCGRIYRTGILMHGKKPTVRELWRWVRYA
jgi:ABC-2 type transport system permease protein